MRMRLSAAYKGLNVLLMQDGAKDFRSGQQFSHTVFFDEAVDIHHIFPKKWCLENGKDPREFDSIVNKTPLSARTNRIIGGEAPSAYLSKLENGGTDFERIPEADLNNYLETHLADPSLLRSDEYEKFIQYRQSELLKLVMEAMGKSNEDDTSISDDNEWGEVERPA